MSLSVPQNGVKADNEPLIELFVKPAGEVASSPGVEHFHLGSIFSTSPLFGTDFVPSVLDGPASDMAESIIHAIVLPRRGDEGQW
ncbi:hypothetical protein D4764_16G0008270 [Takifugu flavidus]|uniref:Uncharacterized protein n=1 Tax=Takifugu flavidus TaxID=433684 RepID=A0A5C6P2F4_9TELE|nr:hypothetical protein D4764_16G0008270 [Takifugu flavidus]